MLCVLISYIRGDTKSITSTSNDRFFRNFTWHCFYFHWEEEIFFFIFHCGAWSTTSLLISQLSYNFLEISNFTWFCHISQAKFNLWRVLWCLWGILLFVGSSDTSASKENQQQISNAVKSHDRGVWKSTNGFKIWQTFQGYFFLVSFRVFVRDVWARVKLQAHV